MNEQYIERYWRDAKPEDAIQDPPMVARFKDKDEGSWHFDVLSGWNCRSPAKWLSGCRSWRFCQVYDAPDPGEGWRLIDVENETKQEGDEYLGLSGAWRKADMNPFCPRHTYRRRIEPAVTYVPFTWEDREQLRGKKVLAKKPHRQVEFTCNVFQLDDDGIFFVDEFYSVWLCKNAVFVDTGKPVGKEVQA